MWVRNGACGMRHDTWQLAQHAKTRSTITSSATPSHAAIALSQHRHHLVHMMYGGAVGRYP